MSAVWIFTYRAQGKGSKGYPPVLLHLQGNRRIPPLVDNSTLAEPRFPARMAATTVNLN
jgi:hypothetical protein